MRLGTQVSYVKKLFAGSEIKNYVMKFVKEETHLVHEVHDARVAAEVVDAPSSSSAGSLAASPAGPAARVQVEDAHRTAGLVLVGVVGDVVLCSERVDVARKCHGLA